MDADDIVRTSRVGAQMAGLELLGDWLVERRPWRERAGWALMALSRLFARVAATVQGPQRTPEPHQPVST